MGKVKKWLTDANGWKRLWFVLSALLLFYMLLINPFVLARESELSKYQYKWAVEKEIENPECRDFAIKPFSELTEPQYQNSDGNKGCYHLYNYRKYHNQTKTPYTHEDLYSDFAWERWSELLKLSGGSSLLALVLSAMVYFLGVVVAWVIAGFRTAGK